jgi:choline kinase
MTHQKSKKTKAIILAAGTSTRLRPLTEDLPKCLLPLNKDAIIDHQIRCLARFAVDHVFVVGGYKRVLLEEHIASVETGLPVSIVNNELFEQTDNAFSLSLALDRIDAGNDTVLVLDGDILFELALLKELIESPYDNACIIDNSRDVQPEDCKVVVRNDAATRIGKHVPGNVVYTSMIKLSGNFLKAFTRTLKEPRTQPEWYSEPLDRLLMKHPSTLRVVYTNGLLRCEIDTYEDLLYARTLYTQIKKHEK